jgi:hypothetical protein
MRSSKIIHVVTCHAEGEVGDVIGGAAPPPGETLWEQSRFIAKGGALRNFVLNEPRRHLSPRKSASPGQGLKGADGFHHHGARRHAAHVGLKLDLRPDRAARRRNTADAGA